MGPNLNQDILFDALLQDQELLPTRQAADIAQGKLTLVVALGKKLSGLQRRSAPATSVAHLN